MDRGDYTSIEAERKARRAKGKCRLGVTAKGKELDSQVGPMASSPYILIFEGSSAKLTILHNPGLGHGSDGGSMAAEAMVGNGVDIVITGTIGAASLQILKEASIIVHGGCESDVRTAMGRCMKDELPECNRAMFAGYIGT